MIKTVTDRSTDVKTVNWVFTGSTVCTLNKTDRETDRRRSPGNKRDRQTK